MLSRWTAKPSNARTVALRAVITPVLEKEFSYHSILEMQQCQEQSCPRCLEMSTSDGVLMFMDQVWVPDANNLRIQICVIGRIGIATNLAFDKTKRRISEVTLVIIGRTREILLWHLPSLQSR